MSTKKIVVVSAGLSTPSSTRQLAGQSSPSTVLPSSQVSPASMRLLPQTGGSMTHVDEQPSPFTVLWSSHCSTPDQKKPSPHLASLHPATQASLLSSFMSSHSSPASGTPLPQTAGPPSVVEVVDDVDVVVVVLDEDVVVLVDDDVVVVVVMLDVVELLVVEELVIVVVVDGKVVVVVCVDEAFHEQKLDPGLAALVPAQTEIVKVKALPTVMCRRFGLGDDPLGDRKLVDGAR